MQHNTLENYYRTNFQLKTLYNFTIQEVEALIPFERDIYIDLIKKKIEEENNG